MTEYTVYECHNEICEDKCLLRCRTKFIPKAIRRTDDERTSDDCPVFKKLYIPVWEELYREDV